MKDRATKYVFGLLLTAFLLAGCGAKQQYYRLSAVGTTPLKSSGVALGIGPVTLPTYIDRAELVFQDGTNAYSVPANVHWTGSLQENVTQVLAADLGVHLNSGNVVGFPWPAQTKLRYQVTVSIHQFHAVSGSGAILDASWRVEDGANHQVFRSENGRFESAIAGDGYGPVVAAESDLLDQLAGAITRSVR